MCVEDLEDVNMGQSTVKAVLWFSGLGSSPHPPRARDT